jgi:RNA polymerase sigma-70 factor (sigma-E family)
MMSGTVSLYSPRGYGVVRTWGDVLHEPAPLRRLVREEVDDSATDSLTVSFSEFYEQRYAPMVRLAVALTGSRTLAEDLVQDSFVRVHARWARIESPPAYLHRTVVNACRSARRRSTREREARSMTQADHLEFVPDELFDVLAKLPYRQRAALVLQFYEGLSQREIADVLGCREGTVASLVSRGLAQLRRLMEL